MMFFLHLFRVRALTANLPTGLQNLMETVVVVDAAADDDNPLPSTSAADESAPPPLTPPPPPPPSSAETVAEEAAVVETTALINENYEAEGAARCPIASAHRILVPLSHNEWVLFLAFFLSLVNSR